MTDAISSYLNRPLRTYEQACLDAGRAASQSQEAQRLETYQGFAAADLREEQDRLQRLLDGVAALRETARLHAEGAVVNTPYGEMDDRLDDAMADLRWWMRKVEEKL